MDIGIGLPSSVPGAGGTDVVAWAREGERAGFSTLAVLDRLVFDSYECLIALAAAAAVTERVRLATAIMISPLRTSTALLAKQAASVDRLSGGRLTLGLAVGGRPDDFSASGAAFDRRGRLLDEQVGELRRIWAGERRGIAGGIGPAPADPAGPPLILGGHSPRAISRAARLGDGWISGAGAGSFAAGAGQFRAAWQAAGRAGQPRLQALAYFALGGDARAVAEGYLGGYYGFAPGYARAVIGGALTDEEAIARAVAGLREAGCDEVLFIPCSSDVAQVGLLGETLAATAGRA
ncbi:MAG TPA: LLM class flavin-dependent oxidoreductase [Trebonia sp.]|jgi:alkanesulfonate monooxygenase SsuD/methylene tetrahydromethanopterin reductase-like flavin-dependent oxidoreductase (luciferase family)|nr:LLM class flavin-dependent oxidoreductase [Trebonia sp.]